METESIDKLFLELSQFTKAKTKRELQLEEALIHAGESLPSRDLSSTEIIDAAQRSISNCSFVVGRLASYWINHRIGGQSKCGSEQEFSDLVGLVVSQVQQRRRVWEKFHRSLNQYCNLNFSHFFAAIDWPDDDALECLRWADQIGANVAEMKAWRRANSGEES